MGAVAFSCNIVSMTSQQTPSPTNAEAGVYTRTEIFSQPESWQGAIDAISTNHARIQALFAQHTQRPVVFVGCGSPYYLNLSAAAAYRALTGKWAVAAPASELLFNLDTVLPGNVTPLVIAVSRSGETSELLAACKRLKDQRGSPILAISVSEGTTLETIADTTVIIPRAGEKSMAQTRSFSAMLLTTLGAIAIAANNQALLAELQRLPEHGESYL